MLLPLVALGSALCLPSSERSMLAHRAGLHASRAPLPRAGLFDDLGKIAECEIAHRLWI